MAEPNGAELLRGLWAEPTSREVPVALLTASDGEELRVGGFGYGADDRLVGLFGNRGRSERTALHEWQESSRSSVEVAKHMQFALEAGRTTAYDWDLQSGMITRYGSTKPGLETGAADEFFETIDPAGRAAVEEAVVDTLNGDSDLDVEYCVRTREGHDVWLHDVGRVRYDEHGNPTHLSGAVVDISERKHAERALAEADRRKDEFLAMLAHELRNPLAPIRNAVHVLRRSDGPEDRIEWARDVIERQVEHLARLIDDLLDVSRITQGRITLRKEKVELMTIVARAIETSRPLVEARKHELSVSLPQAPVQLECDPTRLVQVLSNLLDNAAKYTEEGGQIWLIAENAWEEVVIRVKDTGVGIPAELLPCVFDLFKQADRSLARSQGGLGIGLTLVRRLVELHGGRVEAASAGPGRGSEFAIRIPAGAPAAASRTDENLQRDELHPAAGRRILVVDDNFDSAESLAMVLTIYGHETAMAHDGASALELAASFKPHVVVLDIGLPDLDGYHVARRLRERPETRTSKLVALTGYGQDEDRQRAAEAGFDHHLVKPVDPDRLRQLLETGS
jgi:two-component system CheB/CheR fusion protein